MTESSDKTCAISTLLSEFCCRVDTLRGDEVAELFTDDGIVKTPHFELSGRAQIHEWFSSRASAGTRLSRHFWTNLRVTELESDIFRVEANAMTVVGVQPAPHPGASLAVGNSIDTIVFQDGHWLFAARTLEIAFEGRLVPAASAS
jgi:hypothetical protein